MRKTICSAVKSLSTPDENCTFVPAKIHHCLGGRVFFQTLTENSLGRAANELAPERRRYGVVFRETDPDHLYQFLISGDGYYKITRQNGPDPLEDVVTLTADWRSSPYINQGQATNVIRVVTRGDHFTFYINGHQVTDLCLSGNMTADQCSGEESDVLIDPTFAYGRVGVAALSFGQPGVVIGFDNVVAVGPG